MLRKIGLMLASCSAALTLMVVTTPTASAEMYREVMVRCSHYRICTTHQGAEGRLMFIVASPAYGQVAILCPHSLTTQCEVFRRMSATTNDPAPTVAQVLPPLTPGPTPEGDPEDKDDEVMDGIVHGDMVILQQAQPQQQPAEAAPLPRVRDHRRQN